MWLKRRIKMVFRWCIVLAVICLVNGGVDDLGNLPTCKGLQTRNECKCSMSPYAIDCDCSNRHLTSVPKGFPTRLDKLRLQENEISALGHDSFLGCHEIVLLEISYNNMTSIGEGTFDEMTKLRHLFMEGNKLKFSDPSSVPKSMLQNNKELLYLNIYNNAWKGEKMYNSYLFRNLHALRVLYMDSIEGAQFDENFTNLRNLDILRLTGGMKTITNDTFRNFKNLRKLMYVSFNGCDLENIDALGFSHFPNLYILDLDNNNKLGFEGFQKSIYGLNLTTKIKILRLSNISTGVTSITEDFFIKLANLEILQELSLSSDHIKGINFRNICEHIPNLYALFLDNNQIDEVDNLNDLGRCYKCSIISARHQIPVNTHTLNGSLQIAIPPDVTLITLLNSFKIRQIPEIEIEGGSKLQYIDLGYNEVNEIHGPIRFTKPCDPDKQGITVILKHTALNHFHPEAVDQSISRCIKNLDLSSNYFGDSIANMSFQNYDNLEKLYLESNEITSVKSDLFTNLRSLNKLSLRNNHLKSLFNITNLPLTYLKLSKNEIEYLQKKDCEALDEANKRSLSGLRLDLYNNPFVCTCESYYFLNWLVTTKVNVTRWENGSKCYDHLINRETLINYILPKLNSKCNTKIWLIIGGSTLAWIIAAILLITLLYRNRWCLKYWCIKIVRNRKHLQLPRENDKRDLNQCDAFVPRR